MLRIQDKLHRETSREHRANDGVSYECISSDLQILIRNLSLTSILLSISHKRLTLCSPLVSPIESL